MTHTRILRRAGVAPSLVCTLSVVAVAAIGAAVTTASAQVLSPPFDVEYVVVDLGAISSVPTPYGAIMFKPGDSNTLYVGGAANSFVAAIYEVPLVRDGDGKITGFGVGPPVYLCTANGVFGGIDGGLDIFNGVLLYTSYSDNRIGEVKPGSTGPDRLIDLNALGVNSSVGALRIVPPGFPGAGRLKIASYNSYDWHDATMSMAADGTVDLSVNPVGIGLSGGPEGIIYVAAGNPQFAAHSILLTRYQAGDVLAYEIDANGDPIVATARPVITGLGGAEGAVTDPVTGDFLFSTFGGGQHLVIMRGFTQTAPCPADLNDDGQVNGLDITFLLGNWGQSGIGDINDDGTVNGLDITFLLGAWGDCL